MRTPFLEFSKLFRAALERAGLGHQSQEALSQLFGVSQTTISFWLRGVKAPSRKSLKRIAEMLHMEHSATIALGKAAGLLHTGLVPSSPFDVQEFTPESTVFFTLRLCGNSFISSPGDICWLRSLVLSNVFIDNPYMVVIEGDAFLQTGLLREGTVLVLNPDRSIQPNDLTFFRYKSGDQGVGIYLNESPTAYHLLSATGDKQLFNAPKADVESIYPVSQIVSPNDVTMDRKAPAGSESQT